jgi:type I restriction enzyme, S subunit
VTKTTENNTNPPISSIPEEWRIIPLGDITEIKIGGTPSRKSDNYWDKELITSNHWVAISDINQKYIYKTKERITDDGVKNSNVKLIPPNTVIMSFKLSIGKIAITKVPLFTNEAIAAFLPLRNDILNYNFLYYALNGVNYSEVVDIAVKGQTLNKQKLKDLPLVLPKLREQHKIAEILSSIDNYIDKTKEIIGQTEKIKKGLMQELFAKGIGHKKLKKSIIGTIPEEWDVTTLKTVSKKITDGTHQSPKFTNSGIPFLLVSNIIKGTINWETEKFISNETYLELSKNRPVEKGDILYSSVGSYGVAVVVDTERKFSFQRHIAWIKPEAGKIDSQYLAYVLNSSVGKSQADRVAVGNAQKTVNLDSLGKFLIPLPPLNEQKEIVNIIGSVDSKLKIENNKLVSLNLIKSGLLQVLLTGQIRVNVDKKEVITS